MSNYDFRALDDKDFEALSTDVLGVLYGVRIERFRPGPDFGVDGRWFATPNHESIVQCKHWMRAGFSQLLKHLSTKEKPKIDRLFPSRYILATSVELSRKNKQQISAALTPHVKSDDDIFGRQDIDDLISHYPDLERRHYKLWLSSAAVLNHILHNAVLGRSGFDAAAIRDKIPLFVKTADFDKAAHLLTHLHTVIITGVPGIGKTTLAEQLIVQLLANDYELVSLREITDGEAAFAPEKKQVFYFDDFLGRNMLEALKLQHDSQIVGFIRRVYHDSSKRFILTSRSTILNQGKHLTDLFSLAKIDRNQYEVRIDALTRLEKARILYSHIWHSALPDAMLDELFTDKRYKQISDHRNFNPRLISFITDSDLTGSVPVKDYWNHIVATLANPQSVWDHFFDQMSQDCRDIAYLVVLNGKSITEVQLKLAFRRLRNSYGSGKCEHDVSVALKICTGSVLNRNVDSGSGHVVYDLYNPSIADYVFGKISDWPACAEFITSLKTRGSLRRLKQMHSSGIVPAGAYKFILNVLVRANDVLVSANVGDQLTDSYSVDLCALLLEHNDLVATHEEYLRVQLKELNVASYTGDETTLMELIAHAIQHSVISRPDERIAELCERTSDWTLGSEACERLGEVVSLSTEAEYEALAEKAKCAIVKFWKECVREYIDENDLLREVYASVHFPDGEKELREIVTDMLGLTGFEFDRADVDEICREVEMADIADRNIQWDRKSDWSDYYPTPVKPAYSEDQMIDDLFYRERR